MKPFYYNIKRLDCLLYYNGVQWESIPHKFQVNEAISLRRQLLQQNPEWEETIILEGIYYETTDLSY